MIKNFSGTVIPTALPNEDKSSTIIPDEQETSNSWTESISTVFFENVITSLLNDEYLTTEVGVTGLENEEYLTTSRTNLPVKNFSDVYQTTTVKSNDTEVISATVGSFEQPSNSTTTGTFPASEAEEETHGDGCTLENGYFIQVCPLSVACRKYSREFTSN